MARKKTLALVAGRYVLELVTREGTSVLAMQTATGLRRFQWKWLEEKSWQWPERRSGDIGYKRSTKTEVMGCTERQWQRAPTMMIFANSDRSEKLTTISREDAQRRNVFFSRMNALGFF